MVRLNDTNVNGGRKEGLGTARETNTITESYKNSLKSGRAATADNEERSVTNPGRHDTWKLVVV
jgi:hypothetical protein